MKALWKWGGEFFGYQEDDRLWTHDGRHVGRFHGDEIFRSDGSYVGELRNGSRLITNIGAKARRIASFAPSAGRVGTVPYAGYVGYVMIAGYEDFPSL